MKKFTIALFAIAGMISLLSLSSCKKVWDYVKQHPDGVADNCNVKQIAYDFINFNGEVEKDTAKFIYNSFGDPLTVRFGAAANNLYRFDKEFRYDNQHRLVTYRSYSSPDGQFGDFWHKYVYVGTNKVVDTTFVYTVGEINVLDRPTSFSELRVSVSDLDSWGRVIKFTDYNGQVTTYSYNAQGNLVNPGITYTGKTNIRQTNKVWMFIDRDFSVNQPEGQVLQFNSNNLPYKFADNLIPKFFDYDGFYKGIVTYTCK